MLCSRSALEMVDTIQGGILSYVTNTPCVHRLGLHIVPVPWGCYKLCFNYKIALASQI